MICCCCFEIGSQDYLKLMDLHGIGDIAVSYVWIFPKFKKQSLRCILRRGVSDGNAQKTQTK